MKVNGYCLRKSNKQTKFSMHKKMLSIVSQAESKRTYKCKQQQQG